MCGLMLVRPCKLYAEQVMSYKEEMSQNGDSFDGCAGLEDVYSFDEWIDFEGRLRKKYKTGYVPSEVIFVTHYRIFLKIMGAILDIVFVHQKGKKGTRLKC